MGVGFIHGVMNTDNTTISGETIDYGPCAFIEAYDPRTVFSSIDHHGRYAFGKQPAIAQWNLARLAEALLPLIDTDSERALQQATEAVNEFAPLYRAHWLAVQRAKLGLDEAASDDDDQALADDWLRLMQEHQVDHTLGYRRLAEAAAGDDQALRALFGAAHDAPAAWLARWRIRCGNGDVAGPIACANPLYIPRNHQVEAALAAAVERDDLAPFDRLLAALVQPFDERAECADLALPAPVELTASYRTFCGT